MTTDMVLATHIPSECVRSKLSLVELSIIGNCFLVQSWNFNSGQVFSFYSSTFEKFGATSLEKSLSPHRLN